MSTFNYYKTLLLPKDTNDFSDNSESTLNNLLISSYTTNTGGNLLWEKSFKSFGNILVWCEHYLLEVNVS